MSALEKVCCLLIRCAFLVFQALLETDELRNVPFLILGNKIDLPTAVSEQDLRQALGLMQTTGKGSAVSKEVRPIEVFMCTIANRMGYKEGSSHHFQLSDFETTIA